MRPESSPTARSRRSVLRYGVLAAGALAAGCGTGAGAPAAPTSPGAPSGGPSMAVGPTFDRSTLVAAVARPGPGGVVALAPGTYVNDGDPVDLTPGTTVTAPRGATIQGAGLRVDAGCHLLGLTFTARTDDEDEVAVGSDPAVRAVDVMIENCSFAGYATAVRLERTTTGGQVANWRIANNHFTDCGSAVFAVVARGHVVDANTMASTRPSTQSIVFYGGGGNVISRNRIHFGVTGILLLADRELTGPDDQFLDNAILDNVVTACSEEHISLDCHGNDAANVATIDHDVVSGLGPGGAVMLSSPGWAGTGSRFTGYHLMFNTGQLAGRAVRVIRHDAADFVLDLPPDQVALVAPGDVAVLGAPFLRTTIRGNTVDATQRGTTSSIALYGLCYENEVASNTCSGRDIRVQSLNSLTPSDASVTGRLGIAPTESNRVTGNVLDRGATVRLDYTDFGASPPFDNHGNVVVANDLRDGASLVLDRQAPPA